VENKVFSFLVCAVRLLYIFALLALQKRMSSNDLEEKIYEALSKADVRPTSLVSETSRNLRPKYKNYKVQVSSSSSHSGHSSRSSHSHSRGQSDRSESSVTVSETAGSKSSSGSAASSVSQQHGGGWVDTLKQNWYIILAILLLIIVGIFVYKKWSVIQTLGVGYGLLDAGVPASISETVSGMPAEQMSGEVRELKDGTHPILANKEDKPKQTTNDDNGKEKIIENLLGTMKVSESASAAVEPEQSDQSALEAASEAPLVAAVATTKSIESAGTEASNVSVEDVKK